MELPGLISTALHWLLVSSSAHYSSSTADKSQVLLYNDRITPPVWTQIGGAMTNLVDAQSNLQRNGGPSAGWTVVSQPAYFFVGKHGHLYKSAPGLDSVFSFTPEHRIPFQRIKWFALRCVLSIDCPISLQYAHSLQPCLSLLLSLIH